jgi:WD40 repeat protein
MKDCPPILALEEALVEGEVPAAVRAHLAVCVPCSTRLRELRRDTEFLAEVARSALPVADQSVSAVERKSARGVQIGSRPVRFEDVPGYDVRRVIGRGGQAVVYEAWQRSTQRRVALKVLLYGAGEGAARVDRFAREIKLVALLRHPGIVTIFDSGATADGRPYLAMELIEGSPIDTWHEPDHSDSRGAPRNDARRLPEIRSALELMARVCEAVSYAHMRGVIHRDLKPSNILVDGEGQPRVLDFGLAKEQGLVSMELTATGQFLGTLGYAAPEQVGSSPALADTRADVYSLGVILCELLTGHLPIPLSGSFTEIVRSIVEREPTRPSSLRPGIDVDLEAILLKALAKEPDRRYDNAGALHDDLRRYLAGEAIVARRDSAWYVLRKTIRRRRLPLAIAGTFIALSVAYGATMSVLYQDTEHAAQLLTDELDSSRIERGRLLAASSEAAMAHDLIWSAHVSRHEHGPPRRTSTDAVERQAYWALWDLYSKQPIQWQTQAPKPTGSQSSHLGDPILIASHYPAGQLSMQQRASDGAWRTRWIEQDNPNARVGFSADGARLYSVLGGRHRIFDVDSGANLELDLPDESWAIVLPGAEWLARAPHHRRNVVEIWNVRLGTSRSVEFRWGVAALSATAGGLIAAGSLEGTSIDIMLWDLAKDESPRRATLTLDSVATVPYQPVKLNAVDVSPDGRLLATTCWSGVDIWRTSDFSHVRRLPAGGGVPLKCTFSEDGDRIAVLASDRTVQVWEVNGGGEGDGAPATSPAEGMRGGPLAVCIGLRAIVLTVAFADSGRSLVAIDGSGTLMAWDLDARDAHQDDSLDISAHCARFGSDGEFAVGGGSVLTDARIGRVLVQRGEQSLLLDDHSDVVTGLAFTQTTPLLASCSLDGTLCVRNLDTGRRIRLEAPEGLNQLSVSPNDHYVSAACHDGAVYVWRVRDGEQVARFQHTRGPTHTDRRIPCVAFSPDGKTIASGSVDRTVILWDLATGRARSPGRLRGHEGTVRGVAFSPDGGWLASGADDGKVHLWDARTGALIRTLYGRQHLIFSLAFSPSATELAVGTADGRISLWDPHTGRQLITLKGREAMAMSVDFSHDGKRLVAAFNDGIVRTWDLTHFDGRMEGSLPR